MKKPYIYLDWNVLQYLKRPREQTRDIELSVLISELSKNHHIPYSAAHLRDLASNYSEKNRTYVDEDLKFIAKITNSEYLAHRIQDGEDSLYIRSRSTRPAFREILNVIKREESFSLEFPSSDNESGMPIDLSKIGKENIFYEALEKNSGNLNHASLKEVLTDVREQMNEPDLYKKFRNQVQMIEENLKLNPTSILRNSPETMRLIEPMFQFLKVVSYDELEKVFLPTLEGFSRYSGRDLEKMRGGEKLQLAYSLLDFHPLFAEKVTKKNRPSNQIRDFSHLFWAKDATYFVTEDAKSLEKSKFLASAFGWTMKPVNILEFLGIFDEYQHTPECEI